MDDLPDTPARQGRAARTNPANQYEPLHVNHDPAALDDDELRQIDTKYLSDPSQSILSENESPDVPFTYSVNPYRGCEHGCVYCLSGDTLILMGDGRTKPLSEIKVGDTIYGTKREGWYRRYVRTRVLDHWSTERFAYRITLNDGTRLVASADHRFLTDRGWKFVTGAESGPRQRPHLTTNNKLMGVGALSSTPPSTASYRQGYLCGMIRGDGHLGTYSYDREGRSRSRQWHFRLALADEQALSRTSAYLEKIGIETNQFQFQEPTAQSDEMTGIRSHARSSVHAIHQEIAWPLCRSNHWKRGFLAGLFDAEGSYSEGILRISNTSQDLLKHLESSLRTFGFSLTWEESRKESSTVHTARILGGLSEHLRFFHLVDPAIRRKTKIEGHALKSDADLGVAQVEPLNDVQPMYDITTGTGDFIANGIVSHNCYARPTHEYLGFSAGLDFESRILVKTDAHSLLADAFQSDSWSGTPICLSGNTDPYQPVERDLEITRALLQVCQQHRNPVRLITKNGLVTRDVDLLEEMAAWNGAHVTISLTTLDNELAGAMEPRAARPPLRLKAIGACADAGIPVNVNVAPIIPGLTDEEVPRILEAAADRGARSAAYTMLRLPGAVQEVFVDWLDRHAPNKKDRVLRRLRSLRGDDMDDTEFGVRMTGDGIWADTLGDLFQLARRKHELDGSLPPLNTDAFRPRPGGQIGLFEDANPDDS